MRKSSAPPIASIRSVEAVTRLKSVTAAARELQISQPAVTQALSRLSEEFGSPLFLDAEDGLRATETAEALSGIYRFFKGQFDQIRARAEAKNEGEGIHLFISPSLMRVLSSHLLSRVAAAFKIDQIAARDEMGPLRDNQISIVRHRSCAQAETGVVETRQERVQIVSFRGQISLDEISFADTIYVPQVWQENWREFNAARRNETRARIAVVEDSVIAYSLAKMETALCLQDPQVVSVINPHERHDAVCNVEMGTGWSFSILAGSSFDQGEVRRVFCGWL